MSLIDDRFAVGFLLGTRQPGDDLQAWLDRHGDAVDADGDQVICTFSATEPAANMISELGGFTHPVIAATVIDGRVVACQVQNSPDRANPDAVMVGSRTTVQEAFEAVVGSAPGTRVTLELAGDRLLLAV